MRGQRRPVLYLILISVIIGVAVVACRFFPSSGRTDRDLGQLALQNYSTGANRCAGNQTGCANATNVISANSGQQAVVDVDGQDVTWYDVSGDKIHTQVPQSNDIPMLFSQHSSSTTRPTRTGGISC